MPDSFPLPVFTGDAPLYDQLYHHIAAAIQSGALSPGSRLPSKRRLCALAGVSMSTVETAYSLLAAEGYVLAKPRSGYVCAHLLPSVSAAPVTVQETASVSTPSRWAFDCSTSGVDTSAFPFSSWARITKEAVYENPGLLQRGHPQGDLPLRTALAELLAQYRGVRCSPEQVVVGAGADYLLTLLLQLLPEQETIALEDPGYPAAYAAASLHQRRAVPIPVDGEGMDPEALEHSGAGLAYVTPSHQFPLGVTMPAGRRSRLLHWAASAPDRWLIEDDYDSEFRYKGKPIPALQGSDKEGRVIYLGTFSRSIAPAIRISYLVLPLHLLEKWEDRLSCFSSTVSRIDQTILNRFIKEGCYERHLNRMRTIYGRKHDMLLAQMKGLSKILRIHGEYAGVHVLVEFTNGMTEEEAVERARRAGVRVYPLSAYYQGDSRAPGGQVLMGYAVLKEQEIADAVACLFQAWR